VATVLKNIDGVEVVFCDAQADPAKFKKVSQNNDYDLLVFATSFMFVDEDLQCVREFKRRSPSLKTVAFGPHPTFLPEHALAGGGIDIVVRFDPEWIMKELVSAMTEKRDWRDIKGIGFRENGGYRINPLHDQTEDLDDLPFPDRSLLSPDARYFMPIVERTPFATLLTSRGCPFLCTFCAAPAFEGRKARVRSAGNVLEELEIIKYMGFKEVYFRDENFTFFKERNRVLFNRMIENRIGLKWVSNAHIHTLDEEDIPLMRESGCHYLKIGIESGSPRILKNIRKNLDLDRARHVFKLLKKAGINTHANFMIGLPGETEEDFRATMGIAKDLSPATVTFGICTPYPGSELFEEIREDFLKILDSVPLRARDSHVKQMLNEKFSGSHDVPLEKLIRKCYREFYFRPSYLFDTLISIRDFQSLKRVCRAGFNVIHFSLRVK